MDENDNLSWRARLAKSNVNILKIELIKTDHGVVQRWFFEFTYHPRPGVFKWCKTYLDVLPVVEVDDNDPIHWQYKDKTAGEAAQEVMDGVLTLRKELEG